MSGRCRLAIWFLCSAACSADRGKDGDTLTPATAGSAAVRTPGRDPGADGAAPAAPRDSTNRGATEAARSDLANPLLAVIRDTLRSRNPAIGRVGILEQRSLDYIGPSVVIASGIRTDGDFKGRFEDEMFGVFVANDSLTRVVQTLDIRPTPRWRDYSFRIARLTRDSVRIEGKGATYGDDPVVRAYPLAASDSVPPPA
jgi:hypothetical protein